MPPRHELPSIHNENSRSRQWVVPVRSNPSPHNLLGRLMSTPEETDLLHTILQRMLDFSQFDFGQFDFGQLAEVEIGRSRNWPKSKLAKVEIGRSQNWPKSNMHFLLSMVLFLLCVVCCCVLLCVGVCWCVLVCVVCVRWTPSTGHPSPGPPSAGQPSAGQPSAGQPSAGQPSAGQPSAGQPSAGPPKISLFFSLLPPQFSFFFPSLVGPSLNFVGVFEASGPSNVHVVKPKRLWGPTFSRFGPPPFGSQKFIQKMAEVEKKRWPKSKLAEVDRAQFRAYDSKGVDKNGSKCNMGFGRVTKIYREEGGLREGSPGGLRGRLGKGGVSGGGGGVSWGLRGVVVVFTTGQKKNATGQNK